MPQGHNSFIWYELMTTDQPAAEAFYRAVVGWEMADAGQSGMRYTILSAGKRGVGGLMALSAEGAQAGAKPGWTGLHRRRRHRRRRASASPRPAAASCAAPDDIPNVGRFAVVADPGGAMFMLLDAAAARAGAAADRADEARLYRLARVLCRQRPGGGVRVLCQPSSAGRRSSTLDMGAMGKYRIFGADGVPFGGMMDKPADGADVRLGLLRQCRRNRRRGGADQGQRRPGADGPARGPGRELDRPGARPAGRQLRAGIAHRLRPSRPPRFSGAHLYVGEMGPGGR